MDSCRLDSRSLVLEMKCSRVTVGGLTQGRVAVGHHSGLSTVTTNLINRIMITGTGSHYIGMQGKYRRWDRLRDDAFLAGPPTSRTFQRLAKLLFVPVSTTWQQG